MRVTGCLLAAKQVRPQLTLIRARPEGVDITQELLPRPEDLTADQSPQLVAQGVVGRRRAVHQNRSLEEFRQAGLQGQLSLESSQAKSSQVKSSQVKSSQFKSSQVKPSQAKSSQVKSRHVTPSQVKSSQVKPSQVKPIQVKPS